MARFERSFVIYETCFKGIGFNLESLVEEHKGGLDSDASGRQDFIDVMLNKIKDASLFGNWRQTIIKATVLVFFLFFIYIFLYLHRAPS